MDEEKFIHGYLNTQTECISDLEINSSTIAKIFRILVKARDKDKKIYIMGNGGSASTASHFTSDLLKTCIIKNKKRFKAFCLSDNVPVLLAWANDTSYDNIFVSQLENLVEENDIVIGISGSGNSINVIKAIEYANKAKAITIGLTGKGGGKLSKISKINLPVPSDDMLMIETTHLMLCHLLTTLIRTEGKPLFTY
ncbi:MAG: SIS domain-containing protein [Nitrosopumilaceae archaeon]